DIFLTPSGFFEPKITPLTSDKYRSYVILIAPTVNLAISDTSLPMTNVSKNISVNQINNVSDTALASGIPIVSKIGTNGAPIILNIGVNSASIVPSVPTAITTGSTASHISSTVL